MKIKIDSLEVSYPRDFPEGVCLWDLLSSKDFRKVKKIVIEVEEESDKYLMEEIMEALDGLL